MLEVARDPTGLAKPGRALRVRCEPALPGAEAGSRPFPGLTLLRHAWQRRPDSSGPPTGFESQLSEEWAQTHGQGWGMALLVAKSKRTAPSCGSPDAGLPAPEPDPAATQRRPICLGEPSAWQRLCNVCG